MRGFLKKEWMEGVRTGRFFVLLMIFALFGMMNPMLAKLTPWMAQMMADQLADAGFASVAVNVDAMTSWTQFYKNIPVALLFFAIFGSQALPSEYGKGTLVSVVAKGLSRRRILAAKAILLTGTWTVLYAVCFGMTYGYSAYFWDNSVVEHLFFGAFCTWMSGLWVIAWILTFSSFAKSSAQVLLGMGGIVMLSYLPGIFPKLSDLSVIRLMDGMTLLQGKEGPQDYVWLLCCAGVSIVLCMFFAVVCFDRKKL